MSRVPTPPRTGPQVAPPSLLFASYWQHFWGPASYLLGLCSISDYQPHMHTYKHTYSTYVRTYHTIPYHTIPYHYMHYMHYIRYIHYMHYIHYTHYIHYIHYKHIHTCMHVYACIHTYVLTYKHPTTTGHSGNHKKQDWTPIPIGWVLADAEPPRIRWNRQATGTTNRAWKALGSAYRDVDVGCTQPAEISRDQRLVVEFWNGGISAISSWFLGFYEGLWCSMMLYDVLWCFLMFYDVPLCPMFFFDVLWCSIMPYGVFFWCFFF